MLIGWRRTEPSWLRPAASSEDTAATAEDPLAAYTACLTEQGIELPDDWTPFGQGSTPGQMPEGEMPADGEMPTGEMPTDMPSGAPGGPGAMTAPDGVDEADWTAATEACADQLPQGGGMPGGTPPGQHEAPDESTEGTVEGSTEGTDA